jgi:hypothetical protein
VAAIQRYFGLHTVSGFIFMLQKNTLRVLPQDQGAINALIPVDRQPEFLSASGFYFQPDAFALKGRFLTGRKNNHTSQFLSFQGKKMIQESMAFFRGLDSAGTSHEKQ